MPETTDIPLYTAEQVRELDRIAIQEHGIAGYELMARAGAALVRVVEAEWPSVQPVCILCGSGNNGGDGYVLARCLLEAGRSVRLLALAARDRLQGDARRAADDYCAAGGAIDDFNGELSPTAGLLVDALLGTGLDRAVEGRYREAIDCLNRHPAPVLAVDIPSGLHADSGREMGAAVNAHTTVTFIGRKRGLYTASGVRCAGRVIFDSLAVPADIYASCEAAVRLMTRPDLGVLSAPRAADAHKGDFGHVLVVGGAPGMAGAARLAAEAASRCGAGLVSVATHATHAAVLNAGRPELMVRALEGRSQLATLLARASVVAVGPGLGQDAWARRLFEQVLDSALPLVVDADALNLLARDPVKRDDWVLTPHPGEAARLLATSSADVQQDRFAAARELQLRYGGTVVLKGSGTLVTGDRPPQRLCALGNPGMASGGMGDVLTGIIAALRAQGLSGFDAACAAVCLHAQSADLLAAEHGERGLLAADLITPIRRLLNDGR
jgi:NAD(P)H-hydrate epimerase